ncbi:MAG: hypothetical protein GX608_03380 [Lentisphaerae bacterium]|nr:hypothetical protein [Lentisphaerota bacterium]
MNPAPSTADGVKSILLCRAGFEPALLAQLGQSLSMEPGAARPGAFADSVETQPCLLCLPPSALEAADARAPHPFIFERQRIERAQWIPDGPVKPTARLIVRTGFAPILRGDAPWTIHAFAAAPEGPGGLARRAGNLADAVLDYCRDHFPRTLKRYRPPDELRGRPPALQGSRSPPDPGALFPILQVCATPGGVWHATMPANRLSDPCPGGAHRKPFDQLAPSRSYLKIEEAFDMLGESPRRGQTVADLGAAPGGWTYAFVKRGCRVTAVDNGPMRIPPLPPGAGSFRHMRRDGIGFEPPESERPLDWLACDMLIPPGQALGMMRRWLENGWARRFIINIKLPQQQPMSALQPLVEYLERMPDLAFGIRNLYHDRREVTLFGARDL